MVVRPKDDSDSQKILTAGEYLREELNRLGLNQVEASDLMGVSRQAINNIINGRQTISRAMAGRLSQLTGHPPGYWLSVSFPDAGAEQRQECFPSIRVPLVSDEMVREITRGIIILEPFTPSNVRAASIELTIGEIGQAGNQLTEFEGKSYLLEPRESAFVITRESIGLPPHYLGRAGNAGRLAVAGIVSSLGMHIEPGHSGHLQFWVFNAGVVPFHLRLGEPIVCLEILMLSKPQ